jgi:hypothetical protein
MITQSNSDPGIEALALIFTYNLVLQRRFFVSSSAALGMTAFGALIALLRIDQPTLQVAERPITLRQQVPQHATDLRPGNLGQLFPPSPAPT